MIEVGDQAHLEALPDGTIITWLRIPGDRTSAAVAFVRQAIEYDEQAQADGFIVEVDRTTWISPGGWDPQTPESAGIIYPVRVVWLGDMWSPAMDDELRASATVFHAQKPAPQPAILPEPPQFAPLLSGGTYPRDEALRAAAMVRAGDAVNARAYIPAESVLELADKFVAWLEDEQ